MKFKVIFLGIEIGRKCREIGFSDKIIKIKGFHRLFVFSGQIESCGGYLTGKLLITDLISSCQCGKLFRIYRKFIFRTSGCVIFQ